MVCLIEVRFIPMSEGDEYAWKGSFFVLFLHSVGVLSRYSGLELSSASLRLRWRYESVDGWASEHMRESRASLYCIVQN